MHWHAEREKPADDPEKGKILTHPADASQWNALDTDYADQFGREPRNIRLGMSTDGLNPFGNQSTTHSSWPVFVWPYNLPLAVHKVAVLTDEYSYSRAETTGYRHASISRSVDRLSCGRRGSGSASSNIASSSPSGTSGMRLKWARRFLKDMAAEVAFYAKKEEQKAAKKRDRGARRDKKEAKKEEKAARKKEEKKNGAGPSTITVDSSSSEFEWPSTPVSSTTPNSSVFDRSPISFSVV
ncbi:hypothetical protein QYE76_028784 [Lolium multiflorum]|uniref:Uncharacterized protein n=1 Tax=Lolium multiflorum TaxID=4521 RepID=A0AAD8QMZ7_LOLMU|nr:hypothetical protein QYE76_028784 [Lolium multiflorum]